MTESEFIEANKGQWEKLEKLLISKKRDPDLLEELFVKVSSDLSYARTFYPNRTVRIYLNGLTQRVLNLIQTKKRSFQWSSILEFYKTTLPEQLWRARKTMLVSLIIFLLALAIGAISTAHNLDFTRAILGDAYVEMTNKNINDGDPMAVYKKTGQVEMFWGITLNNIRVAFLAFVLGLFGSVGTVIILLYNGIMVGAFQYFFYKKGLFLTSFLTIWIHGTIEISAIIIAGAAGIILGDGLLNPKTYERSISMQVASKRALRVLLSTVPLFIIAGFLEAYVTRLTELPMAVKIAIITLSGLFIIYHYIIYPYRYSTKNDLTEDDFNIRPNRLQEAINSKKGFQTIGSVIEQTLASFRLKSGSIMYRGLLPVLIFVTITYWLFANYHEIHQTGYDYEYADYLLFNYHRGGVFFFGIYLVALVHIWIVISMAFHNRAYTWKNYLLQVKIIGLYQGIVLLPYLAIFYAAPFWASLVTFVLIPPHLFVIFSYYLIEDNLSFISALRTSINKAYNYYTHFITPFLVISGIYFLLYIVVVTLIATLYADVIAWHQFFPGPYHDMVYINSLMRIIIGAIALILYYFIFAMQHRSVIFRVTSIDLINRIEQLGKVRLS